MKQFISEPFKYSTWILLFASYFVIVALLASRKSSKVQYAYALMFQPNVTFLWHRKELLKHTWVMPAFIVLIYYGGVYVAYLNATLLREFRTFEQPIDAFDLMRKENYRILFRVALCVCV